MRRSIVTVTLLGLALAGCSGASEPAATVTVTETPATVTVTSEAVATITETEVSPDSTFAEFQSLGNGEYLVGFEVKGGTTFECQVPTADTFWRVLDVNEETVENGMNSAAVVPATGAFKLELKRCNGAWEIVR